MTNKTLELAFIGLVLAVFVAYVFIKKSGGNTVSQVTQAIKQASGSCLPQTLPFENTRYGSAQIDVSAQHRYDSFIGKTICFVLDISVKISGADPNTVFKVYANYITILDNGGESQTASWSHLASGTTDSNGNLTINTEAVNPSGNGGSQVIIAVIDSTCDNLLIQKLPQTMCSRLTGLKLAGYTR